MSDQGPQTLREWDVGKLDLDSGAADLTVTVVEWRGIKRLFVRLNVEGPGYYWAFDFDHTDLDTLVSRLEMARIALIGAQAEKDGRAAPPAKK